MKNEDQRPIEDAEIKPIFDKSNQTIDVDEQKQKLQEQQIFDQELETAIMQDAKGAELKRLIDMGYLNLQDDVISAYVAEKGREYKNGTIVIDRDALNKIHLNCLTAVSKQLGVNRTLDVKEIERISLKVDYEERVDYIDNNVNFKKHKDITVNSTTNQIQNEKENTKTDNTFNNENINNVCKELNIFGKKYLSTKDMEAMLKALGLNSDLGKHSRKTVDTFMTLQDSNILEFLAQASILKNNGEHEKLAEFVKYSEFGLGINVESKFYKEIIGKDGNIDIEKGLKFWKEYKFDREYAVLNNDIFKYMSNPVKNKRSLSLLLLRGTLIDDKDVQKELREIAGDIDVFDKNGKVDKQKIYSYVEKQFGIKNAEELLKRHTYTNDETALKITSKIKAKESDKKQDKRIKKNEEHKNFDADYIQEYRKREAGRDKRLCSKKEQVVFNMLSSLNAGNTSNMKNFFENSENAKEVVLLYWQFRKKELGGKATANDVNTYEDYDVSGIIVKYMSEHKEYFKEYFNEADMLKSDVVEELGNSQDTSLSTKQATRILNMYDTINLDIKSIESVEKRYSESIDKINEFLERKNNSKEDETQIYELAKKLPISAFSTEMLKKLKEGNEEKFTKAFKYKATERTVGKDSFGAFAYSAARLFSKGVITLPKMLINKQTREEYMPKVKNHVKNGAKRLSNLLTTNKDNEDNFLGKFIKSFKKEKMPKLPSANEVENINTNDREKQSQQQNSKMDANEKNKLSNVFDEELKVENSNSSLEKNALKVSVSQNEIVVTTGKNVNSQKAVSEGEEIENI